MADVPSERKLVYIAGPYRADTPNEIHDNIEAARRVAVAVLRAGHFPICPHTMTGQMDGVVPDPVFLQLGLRMLRMCSAIVLVVPPPHTAGVTAELEYARKLWDKFPVFRDVTEFIEHHPQGLTPGWSPADEAAYIGPAQPFVGSRELCPRCSDQPSHLSDEQRARSVQCAPVDPCVWRSALTSDRGLVLSSLDRLQRYVHELTGRAACIGR